MAHRTDKQEHYYIGRYLREYQPEASEEPPTRFVVAVGEASS